MGDTDLHGGRGAFARPLPSGALAGAREHRLSSGAQMALLEISCMDFGFAIPVESARHFVNAEI